MVIKNLSSGSDSADDLKGDSPLFSNSAISSHLHDLGYPEKSIDSMNRCQDETGGYYYAYCDCGARDDLRPMKHWCNLRTCPVCAKKRQRLIRRKYIDYLMSLPKDNLNRLFFLTISPENYKNLDEGLREIRKNFSKFLRLKYVRERIKGCLYVIEAKQIWKGKPIYDSRGEFLYNAKEDSWNIHLHVIVYGRRLDNAIRGRCKKCGQNLMRFDYLTKKFKCASRRCGSEDVIVNQDSRLVQLWRKVSENEKVNFHITEQIDPKTRKPSPSYTLNYMLKYISADKGDFENALGCAQYIVATRKTKLIGTTGIFYKEKLKVPPVKCDKCKSEVKFIVSYDVEPKYLEAIRNELSPYEKRLSKIREEAQKKREIANLPPPVLDRVLMDFC